MRIQILSVCVLTVLISLSVERVHGGGTFISDAPDIVLNAPERKVATVLAGDTQTLLLQAKLKCSKIGNLAWIIPLRSDEKPSAQRLKSAVFDDVNWLLRDPATAWGRPVSIFGHPVSDLDKTRDPSVYDIQVLGPGVSSLHDWLKARGFSEDVMSTADLSADGTQKTFFVVVYIGLARPYEKEVDFVRRQHWLGDKEKLADKTKTVRTMLFGGREQPTPSDQAARGVLLMEPYESLAIARSPLNREYELLTRTEYDALVKKYGIGEDVLLRTFPFDSRAPRFIDLWLRNNPREITFWNGTERVVLFKQGRGGGIHYGRKPDTPVYNEAELAEVREFFAKYGPLVYERNKELSDLLRDKFWSHPKIQIFDTLDDVLGVLRSGLPISLEISFKATELHIPRSLLEYQGEDTSVSAHVFAEQPLKDHEGQFQIAKWKPIGTTTKAELSQFLPVYDARAVSVLNYSGSWSDLPDNITFSELGMVEKATLSEQGQAEARERAKEARRAVGRGDLERLKELVALGAKVDADSGGHLIYIAVERTRFSQSPTKEIVEYLLANGASINTPNRDGETPLYCAVQARVSAYIDRYLPIVEMLIDNGANFGGKRPKRNSRRPEQIGAELLVAAVRAQKSKLIASLIELGLNVDRRRPHQETALFVAAQMGNADMVELLISGGADVDEVCSANHLRPMRPIECAAEKGHLAVVKVLCEHGAKPGYDGRAEPLCRAAEAGHLPVIQYLVEQGLNINGGEPASSWSGRTPLWYAAKAGRSEIVEFLLEEGADPTISCHRGEPLCVAAEAGHLKVVRHLIAHGANIDGEKRSSRPPLWYAAQAGHLEVVRLLLEKGAYAKAFTYSQTAAQVAARSGHKEIGDLVRSYEARQ